MKKIYSDYSHNSLYYYRIMNEILLSVYRDNYNYIMSNLNDQLKEVFINLINNSSNSILKFGNITICSSSLFSSVTALYR